MKKKIYILTLLFFIGSLCLIIVSNNYKAKSSEENRDDNTYYGQKYSYIEGEDGWYYFFCINIIDDEGTTTNFYDGINLKYKTMDDYNIIIYDETTGDIKYKIATTPSFRSSEKEKNGVQEREEILKVDNYFDEKQFNRKITEEDLQDLELENFDKNQILELYNMAIEKEINQERKAFYIPSFDLEQETLSDKSILNIGLYTETTGVIAMRIDIIYDDVYLSDLIENNKATENQKQIYENINKISKKFIETQDVNVRKYFTLNDEIYNTIFNIIETFDDE